MIKKETRRKLNRSGREKCIICKKGAILVSHHIFGRDIPNFNKPWNLADICPNCHILVHSGEIIIEGWFSTTEGRELLWHYKGEEGITENEAKPYIIPVKNNLEIEQ